MKKFINIVILTLFCLVANAQNATIRGFVYEESSGEPAIFASVYCKNTTYGAPTDLNGYFVISNIPAKDYILYVTAVGYDTVKINVSLKPNDVKDVKVYIKESAISLETFNVTAESQSSKNHVNTGVVNITAKQVEKIPTIGGQADIAQYLQVLPGVIFTGDQGGQLYIRGGAPVQNKVLLDGMVIYNPFHSIGLFSVFDNDILRSIDVYSSGFGAEFGGRVSSVMDFRTIDGNKRKHKGKLGATTFGVQGMFEGPFKKPTDESPVSLTYVLSGKASYLDKTSQIIYPYACTDENGLPFSFLDVYGKMSLGLGNGSKINVFGFSYNDKVDNYKGLASYNWNSYGGGMNFMFLPGKTPSIIEGTVAYSEYKSGMQDIDSLPRNSKISGVNINVAMTYFLGKHSIKYGLDVNALNTRYSFKSPSLFTIEHEDYATELSGFISTLLKPGKWVIEPGFRVSYYASLSEVSLEPRLAVKYNILDNFRIKLSGGMYSQNLISATSDRDVVNMFYGYIGSPNPLPKYFGDNEIKTKLQKSQHAVFGFEYDPIKHLTLNLEFYYKNFSQLTNVNRNKIYDDSEVNADKPESLRRTYIVEKGKAAGVDLSAKYDYKNLYVWAVYSLGFVNRFDGEQTYPTHFNRLHNINLLTTYTTGKKKDWDFSLRWNFGSGFPFTLVAGFYEHLDLDDVFGDFTTENGDIGIIYDDKINAGRLSNYHRLDVDVKKTFFLGGTMKLDVSLSVTNLYNRKNIFYIDRVTGQKAYQLPIMPSLGVVFSY